MSSRVIKKVVQVAFHRNGVGGAGFHAVLFEYAGEGEPNKADNLAKALGLAGPEASKGDLFLGIVFDEPSFCAVLDVKKLSDPEIGVAFGANSWRGDRFEAELREAIKSNQSDGSVRVGPFAIPTVRAAEKGRP